MNYLAHVTLAEPSGEARLGSLLGDFSKGLDVERLTDTMRFALEEHRAVDLWFDGLEEIRLERTRFPKELSRFSGILIDVFFDHFLVRHWDTLGEGKLEDLTRSLYDALSEHERILPPRLKEVMPSMRVHDWLGSYGRLENIERALRGIDARMRRDTPIVKGIHVLRERETEFEALVLEVFPKVKAYVSSRRAESR